MKKLLVVGAGFRQSFVIEKARELGYFTLCIDGDRNAPGFRHADAHAVVDISDEQACLAYARKRDIDGVVTAATDFGVLSASRIAGELGLCGLSYNTALTVKNKYSMRKLLSESGAGALPRFYDISDMGAARSMAKRINYPVMVKPCDGCGSRAVTRVDSPNGFERACAAAIASSRVHRALAETFITGREYGAEAFVDSGGIHVLGILQKRMTKPPYYAELGHALPSGLPEETLEKIRNTVKSAIRALGIRFGCVNMDLLIDGGGRACIVDVGARMGGNLIGSHIIPYATGVDYMGNMIRAAAGDPTDWSPSAKGRIVATAILALSPGVVRRLPDIAAIRAHNPEVLDVFFILSPGDRINPYRSNPDGCGYVVSAGGSVGQAVETAERIKNEIDRTVKNAL